MAVFPAQTACEKFIMSPWEPVRRHVVYQPTPCGEKASDVLIGPDGHRTLGQEWSTELVKRIAHDCFVDNCRCTIVFHQKTRKRTATIVANVSEAETNRRFCGGSKAGLKTERRRFSVRESEIQSAFRAGGRASDRNLLILRTVE